MKKYYVYEIPGIKIGCTTQPNYRIKRQGFTDWVILEEHTDIYIASDREIELQKQYGYKVDSKPYWKTIKMPTTKSRSKGGITTGQKHIESGHWANISKLGYSKGGQISGKINGKLNVESGHMHRIQQLRKRPIIQMDKNGNIIKEFDSAKDASDYLKITATGITRCSKGKIKTYYGYTFKYKNNQT